MSNLTKKATKARPPKRRRTEGRSAGRLRRPAAPAADSLPAPAGSRADDTK